MAARFASTVWAFEVWPALACTLGIFIGGSLRTAPAAGGQSDKLLHFLAFGLLSALWCRALPRIWTSAARAQVAAAGFLVSAGLGGVLELWQGMLGYRSSEWLDWLADGLGAAVAAMVWALRQRSKGRVPA